MGRLLAVGGGVGACQEFLWQATVWVPNLSLQSFNPTVLPQLLFGVPAIKFAT